MRATSERTLTQAIALWPRSSARLHYVTWSRYLTLYDYGMGGVWTFIDAPSPEAITEKYPQLEVVAEPPPWMVERGIEQTHVVRLDDVDDPFLAALRGETP